MRIMRGIQLDGHHFIDFHYRIWSGRGIDEQASRYRSTRGRSHAKTSTNTTKGVHFIPPPPLFEIINWWWYVRVAGR